MLLLSLVVPPKSELGVNGAGREGRAASANAGSLLPLPATGMSDFPCNYLAPDPSHALSFHYTAPLRAPSPFSLSLAFTESRPPPRSPQGTHLYAHLVWNASIHLADMIAARELDVQGQRVLELGCGAALPGLLAVCKGASKVS